MLFLEQTQGFAGGEGVGDGRGLPPAPSLFELLMQERMAGGFKPAAEYLVHTLSDSYPALALSLPVRRFEETYALLKLLVERYFLARYDALASEKFYGMKRVMMVPGDGTPGDGNPGAQATTTAPLTPRARRMALLFAVRHGVYPPEWRRALTWLCLLRCRCWCRTSRPSWTTTTRT